MKLSNDGDIDNNVNGDLPLCLLSHLNILISLIEENWKFFY